MVVFYRGREKLIMVKYRCSDKLRRSEPQDHLCQQYVVNRGLKIPTYTLCVNVEKMYMCLPEKQRFCLVFFSAFVNEN